MFFVLLLQTPTLERVFVCVDIVNDDAAKDFVAKANVRIVTG
jgi:hypothetical protein